MRRQSNTIKGPQKLKYTFAGKNKCDVWPKHKIHLKAVYLKKTEFQRTIKTLGFKHFYN